MQRLLLDSLAEAYFPNGGTDEEYAEIELAKYVTYLSASMHNITATETQTMSSSMCFTLISSFPRRGHATRMSVHIL